MLDSPLISYRQREELLALEEGIDANVARRMPVDEEPTRAALHHVQDRPEPPRIVTEPDEVTDLEVSRGMAPPKNRQSDRESTRVVRLVDEQAFRLAPSSPPTTASSTGNRARLAVSCSLNPTRCRRLTLMPSGRATHTRTPARAIRMVNVDAEMLSCDPIQGHDGLPLRAGRLKPRKWRDSVSTPRRCQGPC